MPNTTKYNLNASTGAYTSIPATIPCRRVEIVEDESSAAQGLDFQLPSDNFTASNIMGASTEPLILGNVVAHGNAKGAILGWPAQKDTFGNSIAATVLVKLRSKASATVVRVVEYE